jgi:drug/metabolite transporter (DMT)-like permease
VTPGEPSTDHSFTGADWARFCAVGAIWGASFLFIDIGLDAMPPGLITLLRVGLGALALQLVPHARPTFERRDLRTVVVLSVMWVALPFTLFPIAEQHISSSVAGLLNGATPIFAATFAALLFRQRPSRPTAIGIAVGLIGVVCICLPSIGDGSSQALGVALVVLATICYGFSATIAAPLQRRYGPLHLMASVLTLATVWTVPYGLVDVGDTEWEPVPFVAVAVLGVVGTGLAFWIMGGLIASVGSTRGSFITYVIPVVALVLGVTIRDDTVAALSVVGIGFVIAGAVLASRGAGRGASGPTDVVSGIESNTTSPVESST